MGANDPFLHQNLTEDQIIQLEDAMRSQVVDGVPLNPRDIFRNPEKFNAYHPAAPASGASTPAK